MLMKIMKPVGGEHQVGDTVDAAQWPNRDVLMRSGHLVPVSASGAADHSGATALQEQVATQTEQVAELTARLLEVEDRLATLEQAEHAVASRKGKHNA